MKLPPAFTTITNFNKFLALFLFILFPLVGFKLGMEYQKNINMIQDTAVLGTAGMCINPFLILSFIARMGTVIAIILTIIISFVYYFIKKRQGQIFSNYVANIIKIIGIEIIISIAIWISSGYLVKRNSCTDIDVIPPIDVTRFIAPTPTADISNWKTYKNDPYQFSFDYPPNYYLENEEIQDIITSPLRLINSKYRNEEFNYPYIQVEVISEIQMNIGTPLAYVENTYERCDEKSQEPICYGYYPSSIKEVKIGSAPGIKFETTTASTGTNHTVIEHDKMLYVISNRITGVEEIPDSVYQQILSTFRFLDEENID